MMEATAASADFPAITDDGYTVIRNKSTDRRHSRQPVSAVAEQRRIDYAGGYRTLSTCVHSFCVEDNALMDPSDSDSDSNSGNEEADYAFPPLSTTDSDTGERDVNMDSDVTSDVTADPAANGMNVDVEPPSAATAPNTSAQ
ncbi:hypothetical protein JG688_00013510, partial [Phytophthora aleatoria]